MAGSNHNMDDTTQQASPPSPTPSWRPIGCNYKPQSNSSSMVDVLHNPHLQDTLTYMTPEQIMTKQYDRYNNRPPIAITTSSTKKKQRFRPNDLTMTFDSTSQRNQGPNQVP